MKSACDVTMIENAVHNPDEPRHFMLLEENQKFDLSIGDLLLARSNRAVKVKEVARTIYDPVMYVPRTDIQMEFLHQNKKTTRCPLKGETVYFDIRINGKVFPNAAWSYERVLGFDKRLESIRGLVAFDHRLLEN